MFIVIYNDKILNSKKCFSSIIFVTNKDETESQEPVSSLASPSLLV